MERSTVVFDISSDEEEFGLTEPKGDDYDWLAEYLDTGDKGSDNDSDDVVVVGETKPKSRSKSSKPTVRDEDDDCVVLDGDPDKPVVDDVVSDSDELAIVGEKGPIACRDFPHSRHVCISFPFNSTPHEKHCNLCHCYVCDLPAPCVHWATSNSITGHCHATDKEDIWRNQRKSFKSGKISLPPPLKVSDTPLSVCVPQNNQVPPHNIIQLSPCSRPQDFVVRPFAVQACSSANYSLPIISRSRSQQSGLLSSKNRFQPRIVSGGPRLGAGLAIRKGALNPHSLFKRSANVGVSFPRNQSLYSSSNSRNRFGAAQYPRIPTPAPVLTDLNPSMWNEYNPLSRQSSFDQNLLHAALNSPPPEPQIFSQQLPPSNNAGQNIYQPGNQFQNNEQNILIHGDETQKFIPNICGEDTEFLGAKDDSQSNNQQSPVESTLHQSPESFFVSSAKDSNSQFSIRNTDLSSDFRLDDLFFEDRSGPVVADGSMPPTLVDVISPEPAQIDPGLLFFDFDTPWNGLAHI